MHGRKRFRPAVVVHDAHAGVGAARQTRHGRGVKDNPAGAAPYCDQPQLKDDKKRGGGEGLGESAPA